MDGAITINDYGCVAATLRVYYLFLPGAIII
jgi:hypothetical protein